MIAEHPWLGRRYDADERYRSYPIKHTPYRIFYIVDEKVGVIEVDAVWSTMRGSGPPL